MSQNELPKIRRAARKAASARDALHAEIRKAHAGGATLRAIAEAVPGMSHETVRQICKR